MDERLILDRLDKLAEGIEKLAHAMVAMEERMDAKLQALEERMDAKLLSLEERLNERMDWRLRDLEDRMTGKLESVQNELRAELRSNVDALTARLDIIKEAVDSLDGRMASVEQLLQYHRDKWLEHDEAIWRLKRKVDSKEL